ncbi:MAG TPA: phosphatase PAP2 family protein [Hyphomicrobiaceae bacterium]|nr:phosphatase PAP2 family protein [Hyphomicrobiaceae bacterium]
MSVAVGAFAKPEPKWWLNVWSGYLSLALAAGAVLVAFPELDLWLAHATYTPGAGFVGWRLGWLGSVRTIFIVFYFSCLGLSLACWLATRLGYARHFSHQQWRFLFVCLIVGPGLLANVGFKDQWGRARPKHIAAFAGGKVFTPALLPTNQCKRNCSFVSGEASSVFAPFYAAAAIAPQWAAPLIVVGTTAGLAAGIVRMLQGAHFLSDVVFAGLFMALMVIVLHRLMFAPSRFWLTRSWLAGSWRSARRRRSIGRASSA